MVWGGYIEEYILVEGKKVKSNTTPPPIQVMPLYSVAKDRFRRDIMPPQRYDKTDLIAYALNMIEDIESSKESLTEAICSINSIRGCDSVLFGNYC